MKQEINFLNIKICKQSSHSEMIQLCQNAININLITITISNFFLKYPNMQILQKVTPPNTDLSLVPSSQEEGGGDHQLQQMFCKDKDSCKKNMKILQCYDLFLDIAEHKKTYKNV